MMHGQENIKLFLGLFMHFYHWALSKQHLLVGGLSIEIRTGHTTNYIALFPTAIGVFSLKSTYSLLTCDSC